MLTTPRPPQSSTLVLTLSTPPLSTTTNPPQTEGMNLSSLSFCQQNMFVRFNSGPATSAQQENLAVPGRLHYLIGHGGTYNAKAELGSPTSLYIQMMSAFRRGHHHSPQRGRRTGCVPRSQGNPPPHPRSRVREQEHPHPLSQC